MQFRIVVILLWLFSFAALAEDKVQLSAFGTLGIVVSDSERYGYRRDVGYDKGVYSGDIDFSNNSLVGIQVDASISDDIDFVGQAVIRDLVNASLDDYVTLAFLRYNPTANWSIRVGRAATDVFLVTEYRDVNIAYNWAAVPNEVYGMIPFRSVDGIDVSYTFPAFDGQFRTKFFTGRSQAELVTSSSAEENKIDDIYGLVLSFESIDWTIRAQSAIVTIANESDGNKQLIGAISQLPDTIWPNAAEFSQSMRLKGQKATYTSLSFQRYFGPYLLTSELAQINSNDTEIIPKITSGYLSLAYQRDEHTFYGGYAFSDADVYQFNEPGVQQQFIPEVVNGVIDTHRFYASNQKTWSLGWRWDINSNIATSMQWNNSHIDENGGTLWLNTSDDSSGKSVNTLMLSVSFSL